MTTFSTEAVCKAAKRSLKRCEGPIKRKELCQLVVVALSDRCKEKFDDTNNILLVKQVKKIIQETNSIFQVDGKFVTLRKNKRRQRTGDLETTTEAQPAGSTKDKPRKKPKLSSIDVSDWRKERKIVILHSRDDDEGKIQSSRLQKESTLFPWTTFDDSISSGNIHSSLIQHCTDTCKFERPSPIQSQAWPILTAGRDMVGIAETGSGKTLAFALPALSALSIQKDKHRKPRMLVLSPTRELAMQSAAVLEEFGALVGLRSLTVYGGVPKHSQVSALQQGTADCLVATPGRLKDLIQERSCSLSQIQYLVLDEADRMLDMGFEEDVRFIVSHCQKKRQTAMFSATWPAAIQSIAMDYMINPIRVYVGFESIVGSSGTSDLDDTFHSVDDSLSANNRVQQIVEVIEDRQRFARLREVLQQVHSGAKSKNRVLVFALYKLEAERLEKDLGRDGWHCGSIHGNKNQQSRTTALSDFKTGRCPLLIATDVAARGLDIPNVECVINYTFPLTIEDYVHRIGRTGRAGKAGISYTFFQPTDKSHAGELQQVLKQVGQPIPDDLAKFGSTIKKKEHKMYGNFGPKAGITKKATKITFTDDDE